MRQHILQCLERLPPPSCDRGRHLLRCTRTFLDTDHWRVAIALGWGLLELFGIDGGAPVERTDAQGLITRFALSEFAGGRIETIEATRATFRYRTGHVLIWCRGSSSLAAAELWWDCRAIIGNDDLGIDGDST